MESDCDDLLIGGRQVADDRFHSLGGVWGVLWALGDLWREPGLSGSSGTVTSSYCLPVILVLF